MPQRPAAIDLLDNADMASTSRPPGVRARCGRPARPGGCSTSMRSAPRPARQGAGAGNHAGRRARRRLGAALARIHLLYFGTPAEAAPELEAAQHCFDLAGDRRASARRHRSGARAVALPGRFAESLDRALALRDEGLRVLRPDQRGHPAEHDRRLLLGARSLRRPSPTCSRRCATWARRSASDSTWCSTAIIAHEHVQLGDLPGSPAPRGPGDRSLRPAGQRAPAHPAALNRVICLTELERAHEALPDIERILALPADSGGRGTDGIGFETLAIAALRAGDVVLGSKLVERALAAPPTPPTPTSRSSGSSPPPCSTRFAASPAGALRRLRIGAAMIADDGAEGLSLRVRCLAYRTLADARAWTTPARRCSRCASGSAAAGRARQLASRARYQAAALQTELLRLQHPRGKRRPAPRHRARARRIRGDQCPAVAQDRRGRVAAGGAQAPGHARLP